jgi:hypothetical protein
LPYTNLPADLSRRQGSLARSGLVQFKGPETLLNTLAPVPAGTLSQNRRLRINEAPWVLMFRGDGHDNFYRLFWTLKLLQDLHLERLTGSLQEDGTAPCHTFDERMKWGNGWKETVFRAINSQTLACAKVDYEDGIS